MKKFFPVILSVAILFVFSSVALARNNQASSKKRGVVARGKVETAPKRKNPVVQKRIVMAPKPLLKKVAGKPATLQKAKAKLITNVAKKKAERSFFWKMVLNPVAIIVWVPLLLLTIPIGVRIYQMFPWRDPEEVVEVAKVKSTENLLSWDQKFWIQIKEFASRFKKKPAMATVPVEETH